MKPTNTARKLRNGIPLATSQADRLNLPVTETPDDGKGAFRVLIGGVFQMADDDMSVAETMAETLYRYHQGTVVIRDRVTGAMVWSRS